jgi:hypothetical protein
MPIHEPTYVMSLTRSTGSRTRVNAKIGSQGNGRVGIDVDAP